MIEPDPSGEANDCVRPDLNETVTAYCFGKISQEQRDRFETHLLECEYCWAEVQRLDSLIRSLRVDKSLTQRTYATDIVASAGISTKLEKVLGGHWIHAIVAGSLYAFLFAETLFMEVAYAFDQFEAFVWSTAPIIFLWVLVTTLGALTLNWYLARLGKSAPVIATVAILVVTAGLLYTILRPQLPAYSVTQASFQTYTAQAAYLKGIYYFVPFAIVFLILPFNFVLAMQRELNAGRHRAGLEVLSGGRLAVAPRGAPYPRFWALCGLLILGAITSIVSTAHLLEALKPTGFSNLFIHTIQIRWIAFLVLGVECLGWYHWALTELKRECLVVNQLSSRIKQ
jgi:hypothetical protein